MVGRVAGIADPLEALEGLQATGFVRYDPGQPGPPIEFSHPLYRLAVYEDLSPTRRRDLHRSAARVLTPASVLAHRVAATDGADDVLADELEAAAVAEKTAGALAVAARNWVWASALSGDSERSDRRLLDQAAAARDIDLDARLLMLRARLASTDKPDKAVELFDAAIAKFGPDDPLLDRALLHHASGKMLSAQGDRRDAVDHLRAARQLLSSAGAEPFVARVDADLAGAGLHSRDRSTSRSTLDLTDRERDVALLVARGLTNPRGRRSALRQPKSR